MRRFVLLVLLFALHAVGVQGQQVVRSMSGTDFWMAFLRNSTSYSRCYLLVASEDTCTAHIENPLQGWDTVMTVPAGGINQVLVPDLQTSMGYGCSIVDEAWHVSTTAPSIVYAKIYYGYSFDMTAVLPSSALRCDYMTQTYNSELDGPEVFVVAPHDSTQVRIALKEGISNLLPGGDAFGQLYYPGDTIDTLLMRGQTCRLFSAYGNAEGYTSGFSGTTIHSSKPTAVFQGHTTAWVPVSSERRLRYGAGDILYEQSIPAAFWGKRFLVPSIPGRTVATHAGPGGVLVGDLVMVTALNGGCMVTLGDTVVGPLASGETYRFILSDHPTTMPAGVDLDLYQAGALPIEASSPVSVFFYIGSTYFAGAPGDPASAVVPPLEQGVSYSVIQVKNTAHTHDHFLSVVMPTGDVPLMTLNGVPVDTFFSSAGNGYSYARIPVGEGVYRLDADSGRFLAMSYGLGNTESYAFVAGMAFKDTVFDVRASRHSLCLGDTAVVFARHSDGTTLAWQVDGQPVTVAGDTLLLVFDSAGRHTVTVATVPIVDSQCLCSPLRDTVLEILTVHPSYENAIVDSMCYGAVRHWNGQTLADVGDYTARLSSSAGCDSTVYLHLVSLHTAYFVNNTDTICPGDTVLWQGRMLTEEGVFRDSLRSVDGCDSIVSMHLVFHPVFSFLNKDTICKGDTLLWHGRILLGEGLYEDTLRSVYGCDSVMALSLSLRELPQVSFTVDARCDNYRYAVETTVGGNTSGFRMSWTAIPQDSSLEGQPWDYFEVSPTQTTVYRLTVDFGLCRLDTSLILSPIRWPVADMTVRPERLSIEHPSFEAYDQSRNATSRQWWVDSRYAGDDPILYYTANIMADSLLLTLVAANEACVDTLTRVLPIDHSVVWVPNVFTPDGTDNNLFAPVFNEGVAEELYIYNRQGLLVAHIEGENPSWDGTREGTPCSQGAYVWVLYYRTDRETSKLQKLTGTVLLLK